MNLARRSWALSALALTLVLGACSTPDDLATPTLEPQFGGSVNELGTDVAFASTSRVYLLSYQSDYGYYYWEEYDDYGAYYYDEIDLVRYDNTGKQIWSKQVATGYIGDSGSGTITTPKGVYGDSRGYAYVLFTSEEYGFPYNYLNKYDQAGNLVKTTSLAESDNINGFVDTAGNFYFVRVEQFYDNDGSYSVSYLTKYSTDGVLLWERTLDVGAVKGVTATSNGVVFVGGAAGIARYTSTGNLSWVKSGVADQVMVAGTNTLYARYRTTVRKLDVNGRQLWSKAQSGLSSMVVGDMTADANGNVYLTGKYNASSTNRNIFTRKLNSSGKVLWTKTLGTSAYDDARGIATINGSEIYITGATQGPLAHPYKGGDNDGYLSKLGGTGTPAWKR